MIKLSIFNKFLLHILHWQTKSDRRSPLHYRPKWVWRLDIHGNSRESGIIWRSRKHQHYVWCTSWFAYKCERFKHSDYKDQYSQSIIFSTCDKNGWSGSQRHNKLETERIYKIISFITQGTPGAGDSCIIRRWHIVSKTTILMKNSLTYLFLYSVPKFKQTE